MMDSFQNIRQCSILECFVSSPNASRAFRTKLQIADKKWCIYILINVQLFWFQVCKNIGFTCETEYFGLVDCSKDSLRDHFTNPSTARQYDWINLRNPLGHGAGGQPYSLQFRVKFWVPAHLILQESVRNIFYMQARSDLLEGRLLARDWDNAAQLSALLAHADEVKFNARSLQNDTATIADNASGSGEPIGESPLASTSTAASPTQPTHPTHPTHKDTINKSKKRKLSKQKSLLDANNHDCNHQSLNGDDEHSDYGTVTVDEHSPLRVYHRYIVRPDEMAGGDMPADLARRIAIEHSKIVKMPAKSAKYWLLEEIFKLPGFGEETFSGIIVSSTNAAMPAITSTPNCTSSSQHDGAAQRCDISVGPHGLLIATQDEQTRYVCHICVWLVAFPQCPIPIRHSICPSMMSGELLRIGRNAIELNQFIEYSPSFQLNRKQQYRNKWIKMFAWKFRI